MPFKIELDQEAYLLRITALDQDGNRIDRLSIGMWTFKRNAKQREQVEHWLYKHAQPGDENCPDMAGVPIRLTVLSPGHATSQEGAAGVWPLGLLAMRQRVLGSARFE